RIRAASRSPSDELDDRRRAMQLGGVETGDEPGDLDGRRQRKRHENRRGTREHQRIRQEASEVFGGQVVQPRPAQAAVEQPLACGKYNKRRKQPKQDLKQKQRLPAASNE